MVRVTLCRCFNVSGGVNEAKNRLLVCGFATRGKHRVPLALASAKVTTPRGPHRWSAASPLQYRRISGQTECLARCLQLAAKTDTLLDLQPRLGPDKKNKQTRAFSEGGANTRLGCAHHSPFCF